MGFRWFVHWEGRQLGVQGGVRNLRDGRVEVLAEGGGRELNELIERIAEGPAGASVAGVDTNWEAPSGGYTTFEIWPSR